MIDAMELSDLEDLGPLQALEAEPAEFLAEEDVDNLAAAMDPGTIAATSTTDRPLHPLPTLASPDEI